MGTMIGGRGEATDNYSMACNVELLGLYESEDDMLHGVTAAVARRGHTASTANSYELGDVSPFTGNPIGKDELLAKLIQTCSSNGNPIVEQACRLAVDAIFDEATRIS